MTAPASDLPWNLFTDRELVRQQTWQARLVAFVNQLRGAADPMGLYWKATRAASVVALTNITWTRVPLDTVVYDSDGIGLTATGATNPGGFAVPATGTYAFTGICGFATSAATILGATVGRNGTATAIDGAGAQVNRAHSNADTVATAWTVAKLTAGDVLNVYGYQNAGAAVNTHTGATVQPALTVVRLA